jgi:hypothetical protein
MVKFMPTLIASTPIGPTNLPVVHAAQVAGWTIIKTTGGRLQPNAIVGDVAMYGATTTIRAVAQMNRLSLLTPHAEWISTLPGELVHETALDNPSNAELAFEYEFRCFVVDGAVYAVSPFRHRGQSCKQRGGWIAPEPLSEEAVEFCERVLADDRVAAPPAFAIDVGLKLRDEEGDYRWFVCGADAAWQAEIFGCSPSAVLNVLLRACRGQGQVHHADQPWLVV